MVRDFSLATMLVGPPIYFKKCIAPHTTELKKSSLPYQIPSYTGVSLLSPYYSSRAYVSILMSIPYCFESSLHTR